MDPDVLLEEVRALAVAVQEGEFPTARAAEDAAVELAEKVVDLDDWLRRGGFYPQAWTTRLRGTTPGMSENQPEQTEVPVEQPAKETSTTEVDATPETAGATEGTDTEGQDDAGDGNA